MSSHSSPWSSRCFTTSTDHSTPWSSRRPQHFTSPLDPLVEYHQESHSFTSLDPLVEYHHLHHLTITRSQYSTPWSSINTSTTSPSLDHTTLPHGRVPYHHSLDVLTRLPASESSSFRTQPHTRAQRRKEDSSLPLDLSLEHLGRVQFLIRPNTASF